MKALQKIAFGALLALSGVSPSWGQDQAPSDPMLAPSKEYQHSTLDIVQRSSRWSKYSRYLKNFKSTVQRSWDSVQSAHPVSQSTGSVEITFVLGAGGDIRSVVLVSPGAGVSEAASRACETALRNPSPFERWNDAMIADLGKRQQLVVRFSYQ